MTQLTDREREVVATFCAANRKSPVVHGAVIGDGGRGAFYTLKDKRVFRLSKQQCGALPKGFPRWDHPVQRGEHRGAGR